MSEGQHPTRLADCPDAVGVLLPILERMYATPDLLDPAVMMDEKARLRIASDAGKHAVVLDFRKALDLAHREKNKPRVREEIV